MTSFDEGVNYKLAAIDLHGCTNFISARTEILWFAVHVKHITVVEEEVELERRMAIDRLHSIQMNHPQAPNVQFYNVPL